MANETIDISGIDKGELLATLFNNSRPQGMGHLPATGGPAVMTAEQGREVLKGQVRFDYLYGRPLKTALVGDEADPWLYDRDNGGEGTFARIVEKIRANQGA